MDSISEKRCYRCKLNKDFSLFGKSRNSKYGLNVICLECAGEQQREYRNINRETVNKNQRKNYHKNIEEEKIRSAAERKTEKSRRYMYEWRLKRKYGIDIDGYNRLLEQQGGKCALCRRVYRKKLHVDHDHVTGKVRGLLCNSCNTGLGLLGDDAGVVDRLKRYFGLE